LKTCDINKVPIISALLQVPPQHETPLGDCGSTRMSPTPALRAVSPGFYRARRFQYFALHTPEPYKPFDSYCLCNLIEFALANGIGAAINPRGTSVDWVFSYGDLLTLHMFQRLEVEDALRLSNLSRKETIGEKEDVLVGQPSEHIFPRSHATPSGPSFRRGWASETPAYISCTAQRTTHLSSWSSPCSAMTTPRTRRFDPCSKGSPGSFRATMWS